jgi:hypothetical protein
MCGPVNDNGIWRTFYSNEFYALYDELDIRVVKVVKIGKFRWLGHLFRMQEMGPRLKLFVLNQKALDV